MFTPPSSTIRDLFLPRLFDLQKSSPAIMLSWHSSLNLRTTCLYRGFYWLGSVNSNSGHTSTSDFSIKPDTTAPSVPILLLVLLLILLIPRLLHLPCSILLLLPMIRPLPSSPPPITLPHPASPRHITRTPCLYRQSRQP